MSVLILIEYLIIFHVLGYDTTSWGYSYHGNIQHNSIKTRYGEKWKKGDVIGIHLDKWAGDLYFYINGVPQVGKENQSRQNFIHFLYGNKLEELSWNHVIKQTFLNSFSFIV